MLDSSTVPNHKYSAEAETQQKRYKIFVVGLHQASPINEPIPEWMHAVKSTYPLTINEIYTADTEKYMLGQILARIALGLAVEDGLPDVIGKERSEGYEYYVLKQAINLPCRNNLLRVVTLQFLEKNPKKRPPYELITVWPCSWQDEKYLRFLVRFFEKMKTDYTN